MKWIAPSAVVCALSLAGSFVPTPAWADDPPPARAARTASVAALRLAQATAIQVDGELNDAAWQKAPVVTGFLQRVPSEGAPASHETEVRIAFDSTALYVAVNAIDTNPEQIVGILTRRDDQSPSDWVSIYVDSFHDGRSAYEFGVNAVGVKYDRYWFNDSSNDNGWDAVWDVAVTRHAGGWRAEFKIPFSQLRFRPSASSIFGFAASRTIARLNETSTWPLIARSVSGYVSSFGDLTGLDVSARQKKFEVMPYALTQVTTAPVRRGDPLRQSPDPEGTVGLDLKYALAPGLTFTGTVNPDFGQVEADPAVVNLSGFETFFQSGDRSSSKDRARFVLMWTAMTATVPASFIPGGSDEHRSGL